MKKFSSRPQDENDSLSLVYGIRAVTEAIVSGKTIDKLFVQNGLKSDLFNELKRLLHDHDIMYNWVPIEKLNRLTGGKNHQGVAAFLSPVSFQSIEDLLPRIFEQGKTPLLLMLDRVTDVRNFGAIARTAECAGVDAIIIPSRGAAAVNGDAVKTSAGALHKIPVCREHNLKDTIDFLKTSGLVVVACTEKGAVPHYQCDLRKPLLIIMGSEEDGISGEYLKRSDQRALIPMKGTIASLNVSVAAGVLLFETLRQRSTA